jgi:gliding motility-associated-like protein
MKKTVLLFILISQFILGHNPSNNPLEKNLPRTVFWKNSKLKKPLFNVPPILSATGNQIYCPQTQTKIVIDFNIIDPDDSGIDAIYIQISSGYINPQDILILSGNHPNIASTWNQASGKLTLTGVTNQPTYTEIIAAVKDIVFQNNSANPSGTRTFSITVGQANYLPSTGHYYEYVPNIGITWLNAKIAAENSTYYVLQGYLVTIASTEEVQISGEQASGAGWIGGSDEQTEGIWKWMSGPENGTIFWNGGINGFTSTFAKWNNSEPNNFNNENYAHITAPGIGIPGSWNDLSNVGELSGAYQPKGYIVEYGGMPGDPILNISASTSIIIPTINPVAGYGICDFGSLTLNATATEGIVSWYDTQIGGSPIATGNSFTTPILSTTTTYYLDASTVGCTTFNRTPLTVTVYERPILTINNMIPICEGNSVVLNSTSSIGIVKWYNDATSATPIFIGSSFSTPILNSTTPYYVEADNNNCASVPRSTVNVIVNPNPTPVNDIENTICEGDEITLTAEIAGMSYEWSTGALSQSIFVTTEETFSVKITNSFGCSTNQNFTVNINETPIISGVTILNNFVTIETNPGDFEYSIDGINFQNSNTFSLPNGGIYTAFVIDKYNCGSEDDYTFLHIVYPSVFTPNGDGLNDFWSIKGMDFYSNPKVSIFDRYGRLITVLNSQNPLWDGFFNGKSLPSDDYWFSAKIDETLPEKIGHFSLKR